MLDREIDDVARAMTEAPADPAFAGRVSMRIAEASGGPERAAPRRGPLWSRPWMLVPIAAACALMLAVFVGRPFQGRHGGAESPAPRGVERAFQARGDGDPDLSAEALAKAERVALRNPAARVARLPELPPAMIAPIQVDRLTVQPIVEVSAIDINPIGIDRIEISAMP